MKPDAHEDARYRKGDYNAIDTEERLMFQLLRRSIQAMQLSPSAVQILDLGCGNGNTAKRLLAQGYQVKGLDFSAVAVAKAKQNGIDAEVCNLDEGIPASNGTYHIAWAGDVLEHVFDPIGLLTEVQRVLRPGGYLLVTIPSDVGIISRLKMLFGISHQEQMYRTSGFYKHHTFFSPSLIRYMLTKAGLREIDFQRVLILGSRHRVMPSVPAPFFNEMVIRAQKV
ncbi:MAG: class I SAM-dependent methyltransferase [Candidatus Saccharibacteria bacterium]|nr:class I SAM-dependent methyltransferase [Candidatus Saccharibacteria bacterium]